MTTNLPRSGTSFIGRTQEVRELAGLLADSNCRLVTLVGLGGSGKSRLALESARQLQFPHGAHFVPLTPISAATDIFQAIAQVFALHFGAGDSPKQELLDYLSGRRLLLLLDNFEHVLDGGAEIVSEILEAAPDVKILVTSRQALNLQEEWVRAVSGLDLPASIALFTERTSRIQGEFSLVNSQTCVSRICQLVEGLPLAIELAAAWMRALPCGQIADEIAQNLAFLTSPHHNVPERHRSMKAVFEHSWKLLDKNEQRVFARLSVFRGGFTREAAEVVAGATVHVLAALVDKSLLRAEGRYSLHELLRQYAVEQLEAWGGTEAMHDAHSTYYLHFMAQQAAHLKGQRQVEAKRELLAELDNVRAAWNRAVVVKHHALIEMTLETLRIFYEEGFSTDQTLALEILQNAGAVFDPQQPVYWRLRASYASIMFRGESSRAELERCLEIARMRRDQAEIAYCLFALAYTIAFGDNDIESALECWEESCALYRQLGEPFWVARTLVQIGFWALALGRAAESNRALMEGLKLSQQMGDQYGVALTMLLMARMPELNGDDIENERILRDAMRLYEEIGSLGWAAYSKAILCLSVLIPRGELETTRVLAEEAFQESVDAHFLVHGVRNSLCALGTIASLEGDYRRGQQYLEKSRPLTLRNPVDTEYMEWAEALTACGMGDYPLAAKALRVLLQHSETPGYTLLIATRALPIAAILCSRDGRLEDAVELLSLTHTYPSGTIGWVSRWELTVTLRCDLEAKLGTQTFDAAWKRGKTRDVAQTMRDILHALSDNANRLQLPAGSSVDQLTAREREILGLVAGGLSDREIASRLVLSLATVKWHNRQIFDKLHVRKRTQAIVRGRELHLID